MNQMTVGRQGPVLMIVFLYEVEEEADNSGIVRGKLMIEIGEAKEGTHFLEFDGGWPSGDTIEFHGVHGKLFWFYNHPKIFNLKDIKLVFLELKIEVKLGYLLEDTMSSFLIGFEVRGGNKEVVHVDDKLSLSNHTYLRTSCL